MENIEFLRKKLIKSAKKQVKESYEGNETHIIKSVALLEDLDSIINLLIEQLKEWYGVHFPELEELAEDEKYLELIIKIGNRKEFKKAKIAGILNEKAGEIEQKAKDSIGAEVSEEALTEMQKLAKNALNLKKQRETNAGFIEKAMQKELPNFTKLAGPTLGAKILAGAGSKQKLAFLPASSIQIIGAEKALFIHFKKGGKSPKYGHLFQHPMVKKTRKDNKGKMARSLAAKLSIAVKEDYFGKKSIAEQLQKQLDVRFKDLEKRKVKVQKAKPINKNKRRKR